MRRSDDEINFTDSLDVFYSRLGDNCQVRIPLTREICSITMCLSMLTFITTIPCACSCVFWARRKRTECRTTVCRAAHLTQALALRGDKHSLCGSGTVMNFPLFDSHYL